MSKSLFNAGEVVASGVTWIEDRHLGVFDRPFAVIAANDLVQEIGDVVALSLSEKVALCHVLTEYLHAQAQIVYWSRDSWISLPDLEERVRARFAELGEAFTQRVSLAADGRFGILDWSSLFTPVSADDLKAEAAWESAW